MTDTPSLSKIINGKALAAQWRETIAEKIRRLRDTRRLQPGLAVLMVGDNPASDIYVRNKIKQCQSVGIKSLERRLPASIKESELLLIIEGLNDDPSIHGVLVQLPLPRHIDPDRIIPSIRPEKDVDGFHPINAGLLMTGGTGLIPCTPLACIAMLKSCVKSPEGLEAVVVGRSNIVGKPLSHLLLRENCTVTVAHSRTENLPGVCRRADILIAAVGKPKMIVGDWIKPGAIVIDVGINRVAVAGNKTVVVGDVDFDAVLPVAGAISPVPGGVGPMTIACLLHNTLIACKRLHNVDD